ncbi:MAG: lytic transglycosylase domain-containing protein [Treponema sp.]|nr:lytic transglycosylase domain-containing protein [Treponema sp.]
MFRREIRIALLLCIAIAPLLFPSCETTRVLDLQPQHVRELLRQGDVDFIAGAELPADFSQAVSRLTELSQVHPAAAFYAAILTGTQETSPHNRLLQALLFSAALESPSLPARREAAHRLAKLILEAKDAREVQPIFTFLSEARTSEREDFVLLRAASLYRLGHYGKAVALLPAEPAGGWEQAVALLAEWKVATSAGSEPYSAYASDFSGLSEAETELFRQKIVTFLFELNAGDIQRWAYAQALDSKTLLTPAERGVIVSRRFPVSHAVTLNNLRLALKDGGLLFLRYPSLIEDLARAYQLTPAMREEGVKLLAGWNGFLESGTLPSSLFPVDKSPEDFYALNAFVSTLDSEAVNARRYLLLHYAGRIERARERIPKSTELFRRALELAPDAVQADACIWYILTDTVVNDPANAAPEFLKTMPQWTDMRVFDGALDRLSRQLVSEREWDTLLEVFYALEAKTAAGTPAGASLGQFAWIAGRALQEGFLTAGKGSRSADAFFRTAFQQPGASLYYRTMAAGHLNKKFSPAGRGSARDNARREQRKAASLSRGGELEFLLGFFEHGASSFALPFIRAQEEALSAPELRIAAQALADAENWAESIRLTARFTRRPGHQLTRQDLHLLHPRPYAALIERYARDMDIAPEVLFGLIRTESFFVSGIVSHAGAVGLAQIMPATAEDIAARIARAGGGNLRASGTIDLTDPEINVRLGAFYLRHLTNNQMDGSPMLGLFAYNGGQGRVRRWVAANREREDGALPIDLFLETIIYPETRNYGRYVLSAAAVYGYLYYGRTMEEVAASILPF